MNERLTSIILAAGRSSRMGRPKAFLKVQGRTFLECVVQAHTDCGLCPLVVLSPDLARHTSMHPATSRIIVNPLPERGPLSSLLTALEQVRDRDGFILHPVDHPLVNSQTIRALIAAWKRVPACILIPEYRGQKGHPVLFPMKFYPDLFEAPLDKGARWVVHNNLASLHRVPVSDPGIARNIDRPQDYLRLVTREFNSAQ